MLQYNKGYGVYIRIISHFMEIFQLYIFKA